jgi:hypothetical protein
MPWGMKGVTHQEAGLPPDIAPGKQVQLSACDCDLSVLIPLRPLGRAFALRDVVADAHRARGVSAPILQGHLRAQEPVVSARLIHHRFLVVGPRLRRLEDGPFILPIPRGQLALTHRAEAGLSFPSSLKAQIPGGLHGEFGESFNHKWTRMDADKQGTNEKRSARSHSTSAWTDYLLLATRRCSSSQW